MKTVRKKVQKIISFFLIITLVSGCSAQDTATVINKKLEDNTLTTRLGDLESKSEPLKNQSYKTSVEEFDYDVHAVYIKVFPSYDENGSLVTREVYEDFIARERHYNPELNCTVWYSDHDLEDTNSINVDDSGMQGTIRVRGNSSRGNPMKNFKVKLTQSGDKIFGYDSLNINKHYVDATRSRNKACMDLMQLVSTNFVSMETKYLHLYISDVDEQGNETEFIDQGLYCFVEQPNKDFLVNHGLDPNGTVYKSMAFEFRSYDEEVRSKDDPLYDQALYEEVIKPLANPDHDKLRNMLDAVNNYSLDFRDVMAQYFDEENYLTWMAFNILLGNIDTLSHNFLIYSPKNTDTWYMMPWDFDGGLKNHGVTDMGLNNYETFGVHFYWTIPLHQRYFRIEGNLEKLNNKIIEIKDTFMTQDNINYVQNQTIEIVSPFIDRLPATRNPFLSDIYSENLYGKVIEEINSWDQSIQNNFDRYFLNLENPTSGNVLQPVYEKDKWVFRWDPSYDFQQETITYDFFLSTDPEFDNVIAEEHDLPTPYFTIEEIPKGHLYFKYVARDSSGNEQHPLNRLSIKTLDGETLVKKSGVGYYDNESGDVYVIENEIFGDDLESN